MTNLKRGFSEPNSVALPPLAAAPRSKRGWAISHRVVAPAAMAVDALIIFATCLLSGVVYHLELTGTKGNLQQFVGFAAIVAALFITFVNSRDLYTLPELLNLKSQIRQNHHQVVRRLPFSYSRRFRDEVGRKLFARLDNNFCCFRSRGVAARAGWLADFPR